MFLAGGPRHGNNHDKPEQHESHVEKLQYEDDCLDKKKSVPLERELEPLQHEEEESPCEAEAGSDEETHVIGRRHQLTTTEAIRPAFTQLGRNAKRNFDRSKSFSQCAIGLRLLSFQNGQSLPRETDSPVCVFANGLHCQIRN
jgi:hypothetical protein